MVEGQRAGVLYFLESGTVEIVKRGHLISTVAQPGAVFGEVSMLLDQAPMATVRAGSEVVCRVVENPREFLEKQPAVALHVATLIKDGGTLQLGIGAIPDAALRRLTDKQDLGLHTEMFSDGVIDLVEAGVITNRRKKVHPGRIVTSFAMGTERLYRFIDDNPLVEFHPCDRTNDTSLIRKNDKVVAINSAIEVDLSGQVVADSIGFRVFSGIGGQMDFMRGAALSKGGKPILALPSTAKGGKLSRITAELTAGAGVVTTRGHVQWIVTEYGAVNLHGIPLRQRGEALISIAHPDFRAELGRDLARIRHFVLAAKQEAPAERP